MSVIQSPSEIDTGSGSGNQPEHARVAEIALAEIKAEIIPHEHEEALIGGLVEAELLLEALDKFRV